MSEEKTEMLNADSTNPLPIEVLFKQFTDYMTRRFDQLEAEVRANRDETKELGERITSLEVRMTAVETELAGVKLELSGVKGQLDYVEERIIDLDEKVDAFVKETIHLKRELKQLKPVV
jgi:chromosome segregation ATPase